jgi:hypothetical protein
MTSKWNPIVVLPEISRPMHELLEEFKNEVIRFNKASAEISAEINEQGKRDHLNKEHIRGLIKFVIGDALSERQIRRLLPEELKYAEKLRDQSHRKLLILNESESADILTANQEEIKPEDYNIDDLWKYPAELKDQIIKDEFDENKRYYKASTRIQTFVAAILSPPLNGYSISRH